MSIEAVIGAKTEKAISEKKDKPDLSSVFDDWKNNTSKAENQAERKSINEAVHKHLPNITIIDFGTGKTPAGEAKYVETYDSSTHKLEVRKVEDFSVVQSQDLTKDLETRKMTDEQAIQTLTDNVDSYKTAENKTEQPAKDKPEVVDPAKPEAITATKQYTIQPGDNLWKIARREIAEANKASGKPDSVPSAVEVKAFVDKLIFANQSGDSPVKNANLIYAGKILNVPVETAPAEKKEEVPADKKEEVPPVENKEVPENKSVEPEKVTPTPSSSSSSEPEFNDPKLTGLRVFN